MCGIFAAVGCNLQASALENVLHALSHRGPDGHGVYRDESARLTVAHTRLAIIDLETGAQPMHSADGNIILACNGEIYDFENIRSTLQKKGHKFATKSDSEVIIYLYEQFGFECFEHLRGEFAFLLYDRSKRLLLAARDRFGIKPLYYSRRPDGIVLGSEMKAIFASDLVEARLNAAALDPFLDQDPDAARFPFEGVEHVPPGCYMTIDVDTLETRTVRYWSRDIPTETADPVADAFGETASLSARSILQRLEDAVALRLRSDVPVGLYLSGGIDSAFVAALMKRKLDCPLHSFSISFVGSDKDEREFAQKTADFVGTVHHELAVSKDMLWDHVEDCLWFSELPFVTLAPVGKYLLSETARKTVTVVLTGEGADEVFLGYRGFFRRAIDDTRQRQSKTPPKSARRRRLRSGGFSGRLLETLSPLVFHRSQRRPLRRARADVQSHSPTTPEKPAINMVQEGRIAGMPLDILCFLGDRVEMAHSLEARLPFLDHLLYDEAKRIPVDLKLRDGVEKAVLRDAAKGVLPDDIRLRRKRGFMVTSDAVDLFGSDRKAMGALRDYLSKEAFERAQVYSYRAYRAMTLLARVPSWKGLPFLQRLRRNSNKVIMYMMQTHMLHNMFVADPRWNKRRAH